MKFTGKNVQGKIIISLQNGQQIGKLKGLIINPDNITVAALLLESKALFKDKMIISYDKVHSIDEIITVKYSNCLERASIKSPLGKLVKQKLNFFGTPIITEEGSILGSVEDFIFDVKTGQINSLLVKGKIYEKIFRGSAELPVSQVTTIGNDAIIAKAGSKEALLLSEDGLSEKMDSLKGSSSKLWNTTKGSTIKWSKHLSTTLKNLTSQKEENLQGNDCSPEEFTENKQETQDTKKS
ncbi:MAG: hypothetical protein APF76_15620 [Desulfitibacter sp. BRH_c19]|nr:MAG: hypothetical protein APF76_15620 [Desulfitibacter sp. BRH_c19]